MARTSVVYNDKFKLRPQQQLITIFEDLDFSWTKLEIAAAIKMFEQNLTMQDMAFTFGRDEMEVVLLLLYLVWKGKIELRPSEIIGWRGLNDEA